MGVERVLACCTVVSLEITPGENRPNFTDSNLLNGEDTINERSSSSTVFGNVRLRCFQRCKSNSGIANLPDADKIGCRSRPLHVFVPEGWVWRTVYAPASFFRP